MTWIPPTRRKFEDFDFVDEVICHCTNSRSTNHAFLWLLSRTSLLRTGSKGLFSGGVDPLSNVSAGTELQATAESDPFCACGTLRAADWYNERLNLCGGESSRTSLYLESSRIHFLIIVIVVSSKMFDVLSVTYTIESIISELSFLAGCATRTMFY